LKDFITANLFYDVNYKRLKYGQRLNTFLVKRYYQLNRIFFPKSSSPISLQYRRLLHRYGLIKQLLTKSYRIK